MLPIVEYVDSTDHISWQQVPRVCVYVVVNALQWWVIMGPDVAWPVLVTCLYILAVRP